MAIQIKRVYDPIAEDDGFRVLVDRLWPRGVRKETAHVDLWLKDVAPSTELRQWYHHDLEKWEDFRARYFTELEAHPEPVQRLLEAARQGSLTLLYASRDTQNNQAIALRDYLTARLA